MSHPIVLLELSPQMSCWHYSGHSSTHGWSNTYLQITNTVINLPNLVKVYQTVWFSVAHFSCHYSDPFLPGMTSHMSFLGVGEKYLRSQYMGLLSSGRLYFWHCLSGNMCHHLSLLFCLGLGLVHILALHAAQHLTKCFQLMPSL